MKQNKIIISQNSVNSDDIYDIVNSNVTVINLLLEEGLTEDDIHEDALASYCVDYYLAQVNNGGVSQYIYNSKWKDALNNRVAYGLKQMGAFKHLDLFDEVRSKVDKIPKDKFSDFVASDYFGENTTRDELNNDTFFDLKEDITELNSKWLKNHIDTVVLSIDDMFLAFEKIVGKKIRRNH